VSSYALTYNTQLTEDFIHAESILASSTAASPLATFVNPNGQSEALAIHDDGELYHLQREPLSNSGWNIFGVGAEITVIAATKSGSVWATDITARVWQSNTGNWNQTGSLNGGNPTISVGRDGTVYGLAEQGDDFHVFTYDADSGNFDDQGAAPITVPPKGVAGALWALGNQTVMVSTSVGVWNQAPGCFGSNWPYALSVGVDGSVLVLGQSGAVYLYDASGQAWNRVTGVQATTTCFEAVDSGTIYASQIGSTVIQCWANGAWTNINAPSYKVAAISTGGDGSLWCLDGGGTVWRYDTGTNTWVRQIMPTGIAGVTNGLTVTEVVTGQHSDGNQYAFFIMGGDLYWSMLDTSKAAGGLWTEGTLLFSGCQGLQVSYGEAGDTGFDQLVVYGATTSGQFLLVNAGTGGTPWVAQAHTLRYVSEEPIDLSQAQLQYAPIDPEHGASGP
jgi:hypothetical protein